MSLIILMMVQLPACHPGKKHEVLYVMPRWGLQPSRNLLQWFISSAPCFQCSLQHLLEVQSLMISALDMFSLFGYSVRDKFQVETCRAILDGLVSILICEQPFADLLSAGLAKRSAYSQDVLMSIWLYHILLWHTFPGWKHEFVGHLIFCKTEYFYSNLIPGVWYTIVD